MTLRFRLALLAGALALTGCGEQGASSTLRYTPSPTLAKDLKDRPKVQAEVVKRLDEMYGPRPDLMRVPPEAPLRNGGVYLAARAVVGDDDLKAAEIEAEPVLASTPSGEVERIRGGYAIYKQQCLQCHGVGGDGQGPTAAFLWPPPRDFRPGIFKFTSTSGSGAQSKPTRDDLRRTLRHGIANTSMPAFDALLTPDEIEQVIDYVTFLAMRGETEKNLIYLAQDWTDQEAETEINADLAFEAADPVFAQWESVADTVLEPESPKPDPTRESILRGRELYLGKKGLQCAGCHGLDGQGNGESFVDYDTFKKYVLSASPGPDKVEALQKVADERQKKWGDDWGNPLRPANLLLGEYKGGRRPIDLYWRIAKGINGTPMPGHLGTVTEPEVWDLVNFVLTLPHEPGLLDGATMYVEPAAAATASAPASPHAPNFSPGG